MINVSDRTIVDSTVRQILLQRLAVAGLSDNELTQGTRLLELGLIDSEDLVEVILEVEERCGCEFNPVEIDLEAGLTLANFMSSFIVKG